MRAGVVVMVLLAAHVAHADIAITKVGIEVAPAKEGGAAWDRGLGKAPDPQIDVLVDGKRIVECPALEDRLTADCAVDKQRAFAGEVEIELRVTDRDLAADDTIGHARGQLFEDAHGRFELAVDGQLVKAWVEVERVDGPSILARIRDRVGARILGALVGILLALALYWLVGARLLSPPDEKRTIATDEGPRERVHVRFWRSPILLASAGASILGIVLANVLRDPTLPIAVGAIPYALGGFGFTAPIIDAFKHEHLGGKRLRLLIAGVAAMFAVPLYDFARDLFSAVSFMATHLGWTFVVILLLLCLL